MPWLNRSDVDLYFDDQGTGEPLFLVAGLASDSRSWGAVLPGFARRRRVIALDNRGVGRTRVEQGAPISISAMAEDVIHLADHLGFERFDLLGHSLGGFVVQACTRLDPQRVRRRVLAGTADRAGARNAVLFRDWAARMESGGNPAAAFREIFAWIFSPSFFEAPDNLEAATRMALEDPFPQSAANLRAQVEALLAFDASPLFPGPHPATLVLAGKVDLLFPRAEVEAFAARIPGAELVCLETAHALALEDPIGFQRAVETFLEAGR